MTNQEIARKWVNYYLTGEDKDFQATEELLEAVFEDPNRAWEIIKLINQIEIGDPIWEESVNGALAAGPIEDLLSNYGEQLINMVEAEAKKDFRIKKQLGMIYRRKMSDDLWNKIKKISKLQVR